MSESEHLERIVAKCQQLLAFRITACAMAGFRSTIAAIEFLPDMGEHEAGILSANIIASWPAELL